LVTLTFVVGPNSYASNLGSQLLVNGDAEAGNTSGWISTGIDAASSTDALTIGVPSGMSLGVYSFTGGTGNTTQTLSQAISIADHAALIDSSAAVYDFSILVQSRKLGAALDVARGEVRFMDANGSLTSTLTFADQAVNSGVYDWDWVQMDGVVPVATRSIEVLLIATRNGGSSSDGYFDTARLSVAAVPEPETYALMLAGLGLVGFAARRRSIPAL
jgi:hypothetical protein